MPKKKTAKRSATRKHGIATGMDDNTFLVIVGGGFLVIVFTVYWLWPMLGSSQASEKSSAQPVYEQSQSPESNNPEMVEEGY